MKNEFEKLDAFMKQHQPSLTSPVQPRVVSSRSWWMPLAACTAAVTIVLTINFRNREAQLNADALAVIEAIEWDMTDEDLPSDVTDLVALSE